MKCVGSDLLQANCCQIGLFHPTKDMCSYSVHSVKHEQVALFCMLVPWCHHTWLGCEPGMEQPRRAPTVSGGCWYGGCRLAGGCWRWEGLGNSALAGWPLGPTMATVSLRVLPSLMSLLSAPSATTGQVPGAGLAASAHRTRPWLAMVSRKAGAGFSGTPSILAMAGQPCSRNHRLMLTHSAALDLSTLTQQRTTLRDGCWRVGLHRIRSCTRTQNKEPSSLIKYISPRFTTLYTCTVSS